jgi:hypothetical protein
LGDHQDVVLLQTAGHWRAVIGTSDISGISGTFGISGAIGISGARARCGTGDEDSSQ